MKKEIKADLAFVPNSPKYDEFIRKLRNMPVVKKGFIIQNYITINQQKTYMTKYRHHYFLCLCDNQPAGYIGVIKGDIRVAVLPEFQKKGIGLFLIKNIMKKYPTLQAKVKIDNMASFHLFQKAGFTLKYYIFEYHQEKTKNLK